MSNRQSEIVEFINCHNPSNFSKNSKDLIHNVEGYFTNVGKPTKSSRFVPIFTNDATIFKSKHISGTYKDTNFRKFASLIWKYYH